MTCKRHGGGDGSTFCQEYDLETIERETNPTQPPALSDEQIDRMVGTQFMCRTVILDRQEWLDISAQAKRANALASEVERLREERNGNFVDGAACCKLCDGEMPYGHLEECDLLKEEQAKQSAERQRDAAVAALSELGTALIPFRRLVAETEGRIPTERLSFSDWHKLVTVYDKSKEAMKECGK